MADYTYWQDALAGKAGPIHADHPQPGFYRKRRKENGRAVGWQRIAIWEEGDQMVATCDGAETDAAAIWTWCADSPITEEEFRRVERGEPWSDEVPGLGHNAPPPADDLESLKEQIESARALIDNYKQIDTQEQADQAANLRDRLNGLYKQADALRKAEKQPHDEAARAVQQKWAPLLDAAKAAADWLRSPLTAFLRAEEKRRQEEHERARKAAEAERARQEEAAAKARARGAPEPIQAPVPEPVPEPAPVRAGGVHGRRTSTRTQKRVEITDYDACVAAVKDQADVRAAVEKAAARLAKAGVAVAGVKIIEEKVAA